jgi:hypothetical protein
VCPCRFDINADWTQTAASVHPSRSVAIHTN